MERPFIPLLYVYNIKIPAALNMGAVMELG